MADLVWIPLYIDKVLGSPRWKRMKDFQRGWYFQLLLECARSQRLGYLPLDEQLWVLAGAHRREMWENHKSDVMACFKTRSFDGTQWIYNERMLQTLKESERQYSANCRRSKSMKGNQNAIKEGKQCTSLSFVVPSFVEVSNYCTERKNNVNPEQFIAFYQSKGWKVGNQPMKDWKAAVITWEHRHGENKPSVIETANPDCSHCEGTGYRRSYSKPGFKEPCECTQPMAVWRNRSVGSDDQVGAEWTEEA